MTKVEFGQLLRALEESGKATTPKDRDGCFEMVIQQGNRYTLYSCWKGYRDCFTADISLKELGEIYVG